MAMKGRFLPEKLSLPGLKLCLDQLTMNKGMVLYFPFKIESFNLRPSRFRCFRIA
jgi:hypothetical protein